MGFFKAMKEMAEQNELEVKKAEEKLKQKSNDLSKLNTVEGMKKYINTHGYSFGGIGGSTYQLYVETINMLKSDESILTCGYTAGGYYCENILKYNQVLITFTNKRVLICGKSIGTKIGKYDIPYTNLKVDFIHKQSSKLNIGDIYLIEKHDEMQLSLYHKFQVMENINYNKKIEKLKEMYTSILKVGEKYNFGEITEEEKKNREKIEEQRKKMLDKNYEHRRKCNVCGKIYVFTNADLERNKSNANMATLSSFASLASIAVGTKMDMYANDSRADRHISKIIDYSRCPNCGSSDVSVLTDDTQKSNDIQIKEVVPQISAADEIKKFKSLLDEGIITQEEFDKKKKELLGL